MKVVFFGINSLYSIIPLLAIRQKHEVVAVFTIEEDRSLVEKGKQLAKQITGYRSSGSYSLKKTCMTYGIPLLETISVNTDEIRSRIILLAPDVICMAGFSEKIGKSLIEIPRYGILNAHSSLLPGFKGANPFFSMIKKNDVKAGCTIHRVNEAFDDGEILAQQEVNLYAGSNLAIYNTSVAITAAQLFLQVINDLEKGKSFTVASAMQHSFFKNPSDKDLIITSQFTVEQALWFYNAFSDTYNLRVEMNGSVSSIVNLSRIPFRESKVVKLMDGDIYLITS